ncbi:MAG: threonylcarbamoyl-AMP synthase [Betaproteobacteria bacterium]|nr:threonylcarbamoyl-AMP synthase [Betaproteobacteria bacterium]
MNTQAAAQALRAGEIVAFPTETVYGLGADASNADAVSAIYRIKGRPSGHPLIVHVSSIVRAQAWAQWNDQAQRLAEAFWPGPLTLILPRLPTAPAYACGGQDSIGLRCPSHPVAQALLEAFESFGGRGVAAPSANRFGRVSPTCADHVRADLGHDVRWVLEGEPAQIGIESTIIDLSRAQPALLRPGRLQRSAIEAVLQSPLAEPGAGAPRVSGSMPSHYAPETPVELIAPESLLFRLGVIADTGESYVVWARRERPMLLAARSNLLWHRAPDLSDDYEQVLYARLREFDRLGSQRIVIERPPTEPAWLAVIDRLQRAAARR